MARKHKTTTETRLVAALCYILVGIIWYLADERMRKNKFVDYHVKQALNLLIIALIVNIAITVLIVLTFGMFAFIAAPLEFILGIAFLVLWIVGIVYAATGKKEPLPFIGMFAEKYLNW